MVYTRSRTSKQCNKGKQRAVKNPPGGSKASPVRTSGENSVGHPMAPRFMTFKQLGKPLKQIQEAVIKGVCKQMKVPNPQPGAEAGSTFGGSAKRTGGAEQPLRRASINIVPFRSVATPYMSREQEAAWFMEQEESSRPPYPVRENRQRSRILQTRD